MMKQISILILAIAICSIPTMAYTIFDLDNITYTGDQTTLYANNWRNSTTSGGLNYCNAASGYVTCVSPTTFLYRVTHIPNVNNTWCLTANNSNYGKPANFTMRFNMRHSTTANPTGSQTIHIAGLGDLYFLTTYNDTTKNSTYCLYTTAANSCAKIPANTNWHRIQIDFRTYEETSAPPNISLFEAELFVDGDYKQGLSNTNPSPVKFSCANYTEWRFRNTGLDLDDLVLIKYNTTESFINANASISGANVTYQCSDGLDNDGDSFIDMSDAGCSSPTDNDESPFNTAQCNDGQDNDGDFLIDYPLDPNCTNATDNSESPKNTFQCNDLQDNDGDGLIDFGSDPSCLNYSDNDESPPDASTQSEDTCSLTDNCVFKETFLYNDKITFHDWNDLDNASIVQNVVFMSKQQLLLNNFIPYNLNITKDFQNSPTSFNAIEGNVNMFFPTITEDASFYIIFENPSAITAKIKVKINSSQQTISFYSVDEYNNEYPAFTTYKALTPNGYIPLQITLNNAFGTYTISDGILDYSYPMWYNLSYTRIRFEASSAQMNTIGNQIYIHSILFNGQALNSSCTAFAPPYYLREQFIAGKITDCGWKAVPASTSVISELSIDDALPSFSAYKQMYDSNANKYTSLTSQYIAADFDFYIDVLNTNTNVLTFSIWDSSDNQFISIIIDNNAAGKGFSPDVSGNYFDSTIGGWHNCKVIMDINNDLFSIYLDGSLQKSAIRFDKSSVNIEDVKYVMIESSYSAYKIDNIQVYLTDSSGAALPQTQVNPTPEVDNTTTLFGLVFKSNPSCVIDSDCLSGKCGLTKKCSSFNWKACDDNGFPRTNWCVFKLIFKNTLKWVGDLILDNFLYFIVFLILLMIAVYFAIMFRRGG